MGKFLLALLGLFFAELWVIIKIGSSIGALATLILLVLSAVIGAQLVRNQGLMTLINAQRRLQAGEAPTEELLQGLWLALAGLLFIFPGFLTDLFGLLLLQAPVRRWLIRAWLKHSQVFVAGQARQETPVWPDNQHESIPDPFEQKKPTAQPGTTVDGEYERKD